MPLQDFPLFLGSPILGLICFWSKCCWLCGSTCADCCGPYSCCYRSSVCISSCTAVCCCSWYSAQRCCCWPKGTTNMRFITTISVRPRSSERTGATLNIAAVGHPLGNCFSRRNGTMGGNGGSLANLMPFDLTGRSRRGSLRLVSVPWKLSSWNFSDI